MAKNGSSPWGVKGPPPPPGKPDDAGRKSRRPSSKTLFQPPPTPAALQDRGSPTTAPVAAAAVSIPQRLVERRTTLMLGPQVPPRPSPLPDEAITSRFPSLARLEAEWAHEENGADGKGDPASPATSDGVPLGIPSDDDSAMFKTGAAPAATSRSAAAPPPLAIARPPRRPTPMPGVKPEDVPESPAWVAPHDAPPSSVPTAPHKALKLGGFDPAADEDFDMELEEEAPQRSAGAPQRPAPVGAPGEGAAMDRGIRRTRRLATVGAITLVAAVASMGVLVFTPQGKAFVAGLSKAPATAESAAPGGEPSPAATDAAATDRSEDDDAAKVDPTVLAAASPDPGADARADTRAAALAAPAADASDTETGETETETETETDADDAAAPPAPEIAAVEEPTEPEPESEPEPEPEPAAEPAAAPPSDPESLVAPEPGTSAFMSPASIKAYAQAEAAFEADPSNDNRKALALAACRIPDGPKAREAFRKLKGRDERREVTDLCMALKVHILASATGHTRRELLKLAEHELANGDHQAAYDHARESYKKKRSNEAMLLMGKAACGLGDDATIENIRPKVPPSLRPELDEVCGGRGK